MKRVNYLINTGALPVVIATFLLSIFSALPAEAERNEIKSYINSSPQQEDYQEPLKGLVKLFEQAEILRKQGATEQLRVKKLKSAVEEATKLLKTASRGHHDKLYYLLGVAHQELGDNDKALAAFERSLRLRSSNPYAHFRRAELLQSQGRHKEALTQYRELLWDDKGARHEVLHRVAEILISVGEKEEALKLSEQARQNNPHYLPVLRLLVQLRKEQLNQAATPVEHGHLEAQIAADLSIIFSQDPNDREAGLELAGLLLKNSDPLLNAQRLAEAESIAERLAKDSNFEDDKSVKTLFDAQVKRGKLSAAEETLNRGLDALPDSIVLKQAQQQLEIERGLDASSDPVS